MKFDALLSEPRLASVGRLAREIEGLGYDGVMTAEVKRDPFLPLALAAEHTSRLEIGTSVAVALPRNPIHMAQTAHDLQALSGGRCILGLGSQVRAHIENRFSAEWSHPAARMEELVLAVRAIWRSWMSLGTVFIAPAIADISRFCSSLGIKRKRLPAWV